MNQTSRILAVAAVWGFLAVAIGAFGAHGLEGRVEADLLPTFEVGARYHMYHALALLAAATVLPRLGRAGAAVAWLWLIGSFIFAGTLYLLVLTGQRWLGAVTPIGGVTLLAGWLTLAVSAGRSQHGEDRPAPPPAGTS
jgi:uncharacterized membrane protein YgdD (TMEM256/DUF423 family)